MNITVRHGLIEDADSIGVVHVESWKTTYAGIVPDDYLASLNIAARATAWKARLNDKTNLILVAENASGIVGFVSGGKLRDAIAGYDAELYAIYLLKQNQGQGIGKMLVRRLAEELLTRDFHQLIVWVLAKNPSTGFYASLGGSVVREKEIEIGEKQLTELAFAWANLNELVERSA